MALLTNLFDILARQPDIVTRLQAELAAVERGRPIGEADIAHSEYLRATLFEALRLHSPVTYHTRTANKDTVLPRGGGEDGMVPVTVRKGTAVRWSTFALNRHAGVYGEHWAEFRPERWLGEQRRGERGGGEGEGTEGRLHALWQWAAELPRSAIRDTADVIRDGQNTHYL